MPSRITAVLPVLALLGAAGLTACTSDSPAKTSTTGPSRTVPAGGVADGSAVSPAALAGTLQRGLATATSARLTVSTVLSGQTLNGTGDLALAKGSITRADLTQDLPSSLGRLRVVVIGNQTYAKLPDGLTSDSARPWSLLRSDSKSLVVSQLAATVQPVLAVASPASLVAFARSASSATNLGPAQVAGTTTTHYRVEVDTAKLPSSVPASITAGSGSTIPLDVYLDSTGRPRQVRGSFSISGQKLTPTITLADYNTPVSIAAPPASEIGTR